MYAPVVPAAVHALAGGVTERETRGTPLPTEREQLFRAATGGSDPPGPAGTPGENEDVDLEDAPVSAVPRRFKVVFHNDDYTTQEFVIHVLMRFFHKNETEARHIMLTVHHKGAAVAGVYTKDVAETKAEQVMDAARENGMPLLLTTEPE
ncbi:MAG: ATP-dependent Clp protease adaptor ClpS [Labilithrix sp.]|nr:ATP-dependent Clp protease adaptor ClpS [Labilithrix sp.]MCW5817495.1 ATP-dependent Clp protease adaptor ClpS [Labilithrix sp.]